MKFTVRLPKEIETINYIRDLYSLNGQPMDHVIKEMTQMFHTARMYNIPGDHTLDIVLREFHDLKTFIFVVSGKEKLTQNPIDLGVVNMFNSFEEIEAEVIPPEDSIEQIDVNRPFIEVMKELKDFPYQAVIDFLSNISEKKEESCRDGRENFNLPPAASIASMNIELIVRQHLYPTIHPDVMAALEKLESFCDEDKNKIHVRYRVSFPDEDE